MIKILFFLSFFIITGITPIPYGNIGNYYVEGQYMQSPHPGSSSAFGRSVSLNDDGNYLGVGASIQLPGGSGHVFKRKNHQLWWEVFFTGSPNPGGSGDYGNANSLSGDGSWMVMGAYGEDTNGSASGRAYIYERIGETWSLNASLLPPVGAANWWFGWNVAISKDGNWALVAATQEPSGTGTGRVYVWSRLGSVWTYETVLERVNNGQFGGGLALSADGSYALIGAHTTNNGSVTSGRVFGYSRVGSTWTYEAQLDTNGGVIAGAFGRHISLSDDGLRALISAYGETFTSTTAGRVHHYTRSGTTWTRVNVFGSPSQIAAGNFGASMDMSSDGTRAIIGAPGETAQGFTKAGRGYYFKRSGTTWTMNKSFESVVPAINRSFGNYSAISFDGSTGVFSCTPEPVPLSGAGRIYIYELH